MLYRVTGIVVRSMDYGENHKIITVLTEKDGKAGILVRGAKKVRSRYGAMTQLFTLAEFVFIRGNGTLGTLQHGEIIQSHRELREQLDLSAYASYVVELTDRTLQDHESSSWHYTQLLACLQAFIEGKDPAVITHIYELYILKQAGYALTLTECVQCGNSEPPFRFSPYAGGLLCHRCGHVDPKAPPITEKTIKLLRLLGQMDLRRVGAITLGQESKEELKRLVRLTTDTHLGLQLKSQQFLDQLAKLL